LATAKAKETERGGGSGGVGQASLRMRQRRRSRRSGRWSSVSRKRRWPRVGSRNGCGTTSTRCSWWCGRGIRIRSRKSSLVARAGIVRAYEARALAGAPSDRLLRDRAIRRAHSTLRQATVAGSPVDDGDLFRADAAPDLRPVLGRRWRSQPAVRSHAGETWWSADGPETLGDTRDGGG